jgi:hypothetical protein
MPSPSIQSNTSYNGGGSTAGPCTFVSANTGGNTLIVTFWSDAGPVTSVTDSVGNTWPVSAAISFASTLNNDWESIWVLTNCDTSASINEITGQATVAGDILCTVIEYDASLAESVRVANSAEASSTSSPSIPLAGTVLGDLCISLVSGVGTNQSVGDFGANTANIVANLFSDLPTQDGLSSGGTIGATSVGATAFWSGVAIALAPASVASGIAVPFTVHP